MPDEPVFSVDGGAMSEGSDAAGRAVGTSQTGPDELRRVLLVGRVSRPFVRIYATDMFSFARVEVAAKVFSDFNWLLPYPELSKFFAFSADSSIDASNDGRGVRLVAGSRSVTLPKYQGEREFFSRFTVYDGGMVPVDRFPKMMSSVSSAHATGGSNPVLSGVHVAYGRESGTVLVEASDGARFSRCIEDVGSQGSAVFMDHVVYSGATKLFSRLPSPGMLGADNQSVIYRCRLGDFTARTLASSKYFDLSLIRKPTEAKVVVDKAELSRAVAGADIVSASRADMSCVGNDKVRMVFRSGYSDDMRQSEVLMPATISGDFPKISVNMVHMRDMLRLMSGNVVLNFGGPTDPVWAEFDGGTYLTMPFSVEDTR